MKRYFVGVGTVIAGACLLLPSCAEMNKPLKTSGAMLMTPAMPVGGMSRGGIRSRSFHAINVGLATQEQKYLAEKRAESALKSKKVQSSVQEKKVRYVAVPVKRASGQGGGGGTTVMKVNAETGKPTGEVFVAQDQGGAKNGDTIKLGGDPTLYFASTGDKL